MTNADIVAKLDEIILQMGGAMERLSKPPRGQLDLENQLAFENLIDARDICRGLRAHFASCAESATS